MDKTTKEKIEDELKVERPLRTYRDRDLGKIIDLFAREIDEIKSRLDNLETK